MNCVSHYLVKESLIMSNEVKVKSKTVKTSSQPQTNRKANRDDCIYLRDFISYCITVINFSAGLRRVKSAFGVL